MVVVDIRFVTDESEIKDDPAGRWVTLRFMGVDILSEFVYDTDNEGNRTQTQAEMNLMRIFAQRLRDMLSEHPN